MSTAICVLVSVATFMELLDTTILNTAIPTMAADLGVEVLTMKAAVTAYLVALSIFIPVSGWVAEVLGSRNTIVAAILTFTAGSLLCGLSRSLAVLVLCRVVQGAGAALMTPVARLVLVSLVPKDDLQRVASMMAVPAVLGPLLGPLVGGYIVTRFHWSFVFFINVPVGLAASLAIWLLMKNERSERAPRFHLAGFFLAGAGLALFNFAAESHDDPRFSGAFIVATGIAGVVLLSLLVAVCLRADDPVLDFRLFRVPTFRWGVLLTLFGWMAGAGLPLLMAIVLQVVCGLSPLQAALTTFWGAVASLVSKPFLGPALRRWGYHAVLVSYPAVLALVLAGLCFVTARTPPAAVAVLFFTWGIGWGIHMNMTGVVPYLETRGTSQGARATALAATAGQVAMSLGVSFAITVFDLALERNGIVDLTTTSDKALAMGAFHVATVTLLGACLLLAVSNSRFRDPAPVPTGG